MISPRSVISKSSVGWGFYLTVSWTWCIALFLPVILVADTGPGVWLIFVACNIAGVAALPFVIGSRQHGLAFVRHNLVACRVFSVVTILCQACFMGWVASRLPWPVAAMALACTAALLAIRRAALWQAAALVVWFATLAAFLAYLVASPQAHLAQTLADELAWHPVALYGAPLVVAGFVLSPYLDLTFHHALRACPQPRAAFAVVFPVLFATMLLFSLSYRDELAGVMLRPAPAVVAAWLVPVLAVLIVQVGFTLVTHLRHLPQARGSLAKVGGGATILLVLTWALGDSPMPTGQTLNELAYRASIGFYGVLVPCWVWAAAFTPARPGPAAIALTVAALLLAAVPMLLAPNRLLLYPAALALMMLTRLVSRNEVAKPLPAS